MADLANPDSRNILARSVRRWNALPDGWLLQRLLHLMIVGCVAGLGLDAATGWLEPEKPVYTRPDKSNPVYVPRPTPGDNARPYRPDMVPKPAPDRLPEPSLPDGTPLSVPQLDRMQFRYATTRDGVPYITAIGDIGTGTSEAFRRFYAQNGSDARYVFLVSRGGFGHEAVGMGSFIRAEKIKTVVPREAYCFSACSLVLAGGIERVVYPDAWVGLHQARLADVSGGNVRDAFEHGQSVVSAMMDYLESMDVDPVVWRKAIGTPHQEIFMLSNEELEETRLATIVSDNVRLR